MIYNKFIWYTTTTTTTTTCEISQGYINPVARQKVDLPIAFIDLEKGMEIYRANFVF
ncbi:hypothetical protein GCM10025777_09340 [Membranihabitans marinus]